MLWSKINITPNSAMEKKASQKWPKWPVLMDFEEFTKQKGEKGYFGQTELHIQTATSNSVDGYVMG